MSGAFRIRLMFEWGGGSLWCGNDAALKEFDVGPVEDKLPLSNEMLERLNALSQLHDTALNWEYPPDPGPWSPDEYTKFEAEALAFLAELQAELGPNLKSFMSRVRWPLTSGSNRSLRSLGRAKARPLTKR